MFSFYLFAYIILFIVIIILLFTYCNFYSFEIGRRRFLLLLFGRRRETSALRACFSCNLYDKNMRKTQKLLQKVKTKNAPPLFMT